MENALKPKGMREYFSRPGALPDVKETLRRKRGGLSQLKRLEQEDPPPPPSLPVTAEGGAAICPERHTFGGKMSDRDGEVRPWNDRWHKSVAALNDGLHPAHRQYFCQRSVYEAAPSQRWRRYQDFQVAPSVWKPIDTVKASRFPPVGV